MHLCMYLQYLCATALDTVKTLLHLRISVSLSVDEVSVCYAEVDSVAIKMHFVYF